jgi:hypothetical protein
LWVAHYHLLQSRRCEQIKKRVFSSYDASSFLSNGGTTRRRVADDTFIRLASWDQESPDVQGQWPNTDSTKNKTTPSKRS